MSHQNQRAVVKLCEKNTFTTNFLLLKSIERIIPEMSFMCRFLTNGIDV